VRYSAALLLIYKIQAVTVFDPSILGNPFLPRPVSIVLSLSNLQRKPSPPFVDDSSLIMVLFARKNQPRAGFVSMYEMKTSEV